MKRRQFIRNMATGSAALLTLSSAVKLGKNRRKITVLHTNDTHSHIDAFPHNHGKYPGKGGVEKRYNLVQQIRNQEKNVLLLDAGDIFQGTPYFNIHGGELELKLMSKLGYDAATMGNHDFDGGMDGFDKALPNANFPFLCANYDFSNTILNGKTKSNHIFEKDDLKIGVFGLGVELDGLVSKELYQETVYNDPIEKAQQQINQLKEGGCNLVICLSHLGYKARRNNMCDPVLAKNTHGLDLIIGGHTHTFLEQVEMHKNSKGKPVLINQVGWAGLVLGRIDFYFKDNGDADLYSSIALNTNYQLV
ncbi:MAG: bifunctional metallophosphatase/5'-nucleotidase [Crocinitomicaceae bacterium]